jgi:hypothetical protein
MTFVNFLGLFLAPSPSYGAEAAIHPVVCGHRNNWRRTPRKKTWQMLEQMWANAEDKSFNQ